MRKRLTEKLTRSKQGSLGYTMTELLVVIGIIAITCAIAIPSILWFTRTLSFKQRNDHAKSIFMAAQQNLAEMRANGQLGSLLNAGGANPIPVAMTTFPDEYRTEYVYTSSSLGLTGDTTAAFDLLLPTGSIEATVRGEQIIIEYNPLTGNVYAVFYSEENSNITQAYLEGTLPRDEAARKDIMLGYYDGSGLNSSQIELAKTTAEVTLVNGEEALIRVTVPMPEAYYGDHTVFRDAMQISLTITGEQSMAAVVGMNGTTPIHPSGTFLLTMKSAGEPLGTLDATATAIVVEYPIDSLLDKLSFANHASGTAGTAALTSLMDETVFDILPGDNITIQADVTFPGSSVLVHVDSGICSNVNPMFDSLVPNGEGKYTLYVSNGRNLQNLNAISPTIADMVSNVVFKDDINWNTTVTYYNTKSASGSYRSSDSEHPARALPYFVPIHNEHLFGTARFVYPGDPTDGDLGNWFEIEFGYKPNPLVPTLTDEFDATNGAAHATIQGGNHKVYNININAPIYKVPNEGTNKAGTFYATGPNQVVDYHFTGLFGYVNTSIDALELVNPIVKGYPFSDQAQLVPDYSTMGDVTEWWTGTRPLISVSVANNPATGALLGAGGYNTLITNCGVYVDRYAPGYSPASHKGTTYSSADTLYSTTEDQNYGVTGEGAVGGLVGYCKSHPSIEGDLSAVSPYIAFSRCFAAIPVSGNMRGNQMTTTYKWWNIVEDDNDRHFGYSNGIGGLLGNSQLTNFYNCYASGDVRANYCYVENTRIGNVLTGVDLLYSGRTGMGAGGFVGTSHGTHYTNCFATGDVTGSKASESIASQGAGGFVGFMSIDETMTYGNDSDAIAIAQRTIFTNCYSVGVAVTGNTVYENFSGANGRVKLNLNQTNAYITNDYYLMYAPVKSEGREPSYTDLYIFRDSYFLSGYHDDTAQINSNDCANPIAYDYLTDLPGAHTQGSEWTTSRINDIKATRINQYSRTTYEEEYFDGTNMEDIYRGLMASAYLSTDWEPATSATTHSFSPSAAGAFYPFSKIKDLDYYGDWPTMPSAIGMAYYETYYDPETEAAGSTHFLFDVAHESHSHLHLKEALDENNQEVLVYEDGYAILSASDDDLTVTVLGIQGPVTDILESSEIALTINSDVYHVFFLSEKLMNVQPEENEFYLKVTAQHGTDTEYTMYFNPCVAMAHANPVSNGTAGTSTSAQKPDIPTTISIRSARQFAALSTLEDCWTEEFRYFQEMNIDADKYQWAEEDKSLTAIGSADAPFQGSYFSASNTRQMELRNFTLAGDSTGIFGVLGEKGTIENIKFITEESIRTETKSAAAVMVGINHGTMTNVDLELTGEISLTAAGDAGLLAAVSTGTVTDCDVLVAGESTAVSLTAAHTGGYIGRVEGTAEKPAAIKGGSLASSAGLSMYGPANNAEQLSGGFLGKAGYLTAENLTVNLNTVSVTSSIAGGLIGSAENVSVTTAKVDLVSLDGGESGTIAGVLGKAKDTRLVDVTANIGSVKGGTAAGFLGIGENADASNGSITVTGTITGKTSAAGVVTSLGAQSVFAYVPADLSRATITSPAKAAGYAAEVLGEAIIQNSSVTMGAINSDEEDAGFACTINGAEEAAGFACSISGTVQNCGVWGPGSIDGKNSAGFAIALANKGRVVSCSVTPALAETAEAYLVTDNSALTINGSAGAAGFALSIAKDSSVNSCYALGTITTGQNGKAAGFVGSNQGMISLCTANISISGGNAFAGTNDGTIARCYGWYIDTIKDPKAPIATQISGKGNCFSAYFANLAPEKATDACVTLYKGDGTLISEPMTPSDLAADGIDLLATNGYTWYNPAVAPYKSFRYNSSIPNDYLYPMLCNHYGDWLMPPQYAYGIAYYEIYDNGDQKLHLVDLSDPAITEEGKRNGQLSISTYLSVTDNGTTASNESVFNGEGTIERSGYAIFRQRGSAYLDELVTENGILRDLTPYILAGTADANGISEFTYDFYQIASTAAIVNIGATTTSKYTATADTRFADTIAANGQQISVYYVRTADQLANIQHIPAATISMTHNIEGVTFGETVADFSGTFTTATGVSTLHFTQLNAPLFGNVTGSVTLPNVSIDNLGAALISASNGSVTIGNISVSGVVIPSEDNIPDETQPETTPETQGPDDLVEEIAPVTKLFGNIAGNRFATGAITFGADEKRCDIGQVFGNVHASLTAGAITVHGDAGQIYGDVSASFTSGAITVNGELTRQVMGTVDGSITVTATNAITLDSVSGKVLSGITNNATVSFGTVKVLNGTVGTLFGEVTGTLNGKVLNVPAVKGSLFDGTSTGSITGFQVSTATMDSSLIAALSGTSALKNVTVNVTSLAEPFNGSGLLVSTLDTKQSAENCSVIVGNPATITLNRSVFGGLVGTNQGSIRDCSVTADFTVKGSGTFGGLVGVLEGGVGSGTITFTSKTVDGVAVPNALVNVNITYAANADAVTIGALAGSMDGGTITGTKAVFTTNAETGKTEWNVTPIITGSIELAANGSSKGKDYIVGGVIGKFDSNMDSDASVSGIQSSVTVHEAWKDAASQAADGVYTIVPNYEVSGSIGMFVGYSAAGTFTDCISAEEYNETFQFLGEAQLTTHMPDQQLWFSTEELTAALSIMDHESIPFGPDQYSVTQGEKTVTFAKVTADPFCADTILDGQNIFCTNGAPMVQDFDGLNIHYYEMDGPADGASYTASLSDYATAAFEEVTSGIKFKDAAPSNGSNLTTLYAQTAEGYGLISIRRETVRYAYQKYNYYVTWATASGETKEISFPATYKFMVGYVDYSGSDFINELLSSSSAKELGLQKICTIKSTSLSADAKYFLIQNGMVNGSIALVSPFDMRNADLIQAMTSGADITLDSSWSSFYAAGTAPALTSNGMTIHPVSISDTFQYVTFFPLEDTEDYDVSRTKITSSVLNVTFVFPQSASEAQDSHTGTESTEATEPTEPTIPTGEAGGDTQENNP